MILNKLSMILAKRKVADLNISLAASSNNHRVYRRQKKRNDIIKQKGRDVIIFLFKFNLSNIELLTVYEREKRDTVSLITIIQ